MSQGPPDYGNMDISMCPVHNKTPEKFISTVQEQPLAISNTTLPPGMDISMCPVHNGSQVATTKTTPSITPPSTTPPSTTPPSTTPPSTTPSFVPPSSHVGLDFGDMDISMCPVHNGNAKSAEAFTAMAQYQREQAEKQAQIQEANERKRLEKKMEQDRAHRHVSSPKFLEGAPRFPAAKAPVETDDGNVVGDLFPDSKPIYGQRFQLSSSPAQSSIPKSTRSKALPQLQLPENVPQVPENLKSVAQQQQQMQINTPPVCTSDDAADIAIIDGKEVRLPGKDFKDETWTFPSHQRFYNAMKKKGWNAAEVDIPYIVSIHNTINQQAWSKIMQWERFHSDCKTPALLKFQGRPQDLSPKARFLSTIGYNAPFDRHDWTIDRCGTDVRYIIDFYDGPQGSVDPSQGQVLATHLDVRPALDSPTAVLDHIRMRFESMFQMKTLDGATMMKNNLKSNAQQTPPPQQQQHQQSQNRSNDH